VTPSRGETPGETRQFHLGAGQTDSGLGRPSVCPNYRIMADDKIAEATDRDVRGSLAGTKQDTINFAQTN